MSSPAFRVRAFRDSDYEALAGVNVRSFPDHPLTPEEMRHFDRALDQTGRVPHRLAVVLPPSDEMVAMGELAQLPFNYHPQKYWVTVMVDPVHRHVGIGRELYRELEEEARRRGGTTLWVSLNADEPEAVRFAGTHGYTEIRRMRQSKIALAESRTDLLGDRSAALQAQGVEFTTLAAEGAEREEARRALFRLREASSVDLPMPGERTRITYEEFVNFLFDDPGFMAEGIFLARVGTRYVSSTSLMRDGSRPEVLRVGYSGTDPEYRKRGLASELKRRSIEYARAAGFSVIETYNDFENPRIWSINERVGFRTIHTISTQEKTLVPAAPP